MDKIIAILVSIVAVVAIAAVVIFGGIAPAVDTKGDAVIADIQGLSTNTITP